MHEHLNLDSLPPHIREAVESFALMSDLNINEFIDSIMERASQSAPLEYGERLGFYVGWNAATHLVHSQLSHWAGVLERELTESTDPTDLVRNIQWLGTVFNVLGIFVTTAHNIVEERIAMLRRPDRPLED